jgi:hypothetical protein
MRKTIDVASLNIEQARALLVHLDSRLDGAVAINLKLVEVLGKLARSYDDPVIGATIIESVNQWSAVNNALDEASNDEIRRLIELHQAIPSTLQ